MTVQPRVPANLRNISGIGEKRFYDRPGSRGQISGSAGTW
jgi:hypothetical protein